MEVPDDSKFRRAICAILQAEEDQTKEIERERSDASVAWEALVEIKKICDEAEHHSLRLIGKICDEKLEWIRLRSIGEL